jgi:hypothetical protein
MFRKPFKPKNPYKLQATSRKAGGHSHVSKLKEKQYLREVKQMVEEEINEQILKNRHHRTEWE